MCWKQASIMKALPVILFAIYISYTLGQDNVPVKAAPKKYRSYANGKVLINYAKYDQSSHPPSNKYTVFQILGSNHNSKMIKAGVPDSPYFPVETSFDQKTRVKKILPEYPWTFLRSKRSAVLDVSATTKDEKMIEPTQKVNITTPVTTTAAKVNKDETTLGKSSPSNVLSRRTINTPQVKPATASKVPALLASQPVKKIAPVGKGIQSKTRTAQKKPSALNSNPKSKAKLAAIRAKPKATKAKPKGRQANPKGRQGKAKAKGKAKPKGQKSKQKARTVRNRKGNPAARNTNKKRNVNAQRNKNQKAKPKNARAGKNPKGKPVLPTTKKQPK